jgi:ubiquinone/menaquinone biosynthesis C-methylase UbiE
MPTPRELKALYGNGANISALLREEKGTRFHDEHIIEVSYDMQTGSYIRHLDDPEFARYLSNYAGELARVIASRCRPESILEAGVGEATLLLQLIRAMGYAPRTTCGFDISWSRTACGKRWLDSGGAPGATMVTGSLLNIPFSDDSMDVVFTSHTVEPNAGNEEPILRELYRVARKLVVLLEPDYDSAPEEARKRMHSLGCCKSLKGVCETLGFKVVEHRLFPFTANPLNPTTLLVVEKATSAPRPAEILACPRYKTPLERMGEAYFSPEGLVAYPILGGIPCLRVESGILASKYPEYHRA